MKKNKLKIPKNFKFHSNNLPAFTKKFFLAQKKFGLILFFSFTQKTFFRQIFFSANKNSS